MSLRLTFTSGPNPQRRFLKAVLDLDHRDFVTPILYPDFWTWSFSLRINHRRRAAAGWQRNGTQAARSTYYRSYVFHRFPWKAADSFTCRAIWEVIQTSVWRLTNGKKKSWPIFEQSDNEKKCNKILLSYDRVKCNIKTMLVYTRQVYWCAVWT